MSPTSFLEYGLYSSDVIHCVYVEMYASLSPFWIALFELFVNPWLSLCVKSFSCVCIVCTYIPMLDKLGDIIVFHLIVYVVTYLNFHCAFCEYFWFRLLLHIHSYAYAKIILSVICSHMCIKSRSISLWTWFDFWLHLYCFQKLQLVSKSDKSNSLLDI